MPRPRMPNAVADLSGAAERSPGRFANRTTPNLPDVGLPPDYFDDDLCKTWFRYTREIPWLDQSHRALLTTLCVVDKEIERVTTFGKKLNAGLVTQHRIILSEMGATPASASKVNHKDDADEDDFNLDLQ